MTTENITNTILTSNLKLRNANNLIGSIVNEDVYLYLFVGRSFEWDNSDTVPTIYENVRDIEKSVWHQMLYAKQILPTDAQFSAPRYDWVSGTVYSMYDHESNNLDEKDFYVLSEYLGEYRVYKCLYNANGGLSTEQPIGTSTDSVERKNDGYIWKYMYTISSTDVDLYLTDTHIPVKTLTSDDGSLQWDVQNSASNGSIDVIVVQDSGKYYDTHFGLVGGGVGTGSVTTSRIVLDHRYTTSSLSSIPRLSLNSGSYVGYTIYFTSGTGAGQYRKITGYYPGVINSGSYTSVAYVDLESALDTIPDVTTEYEICPTVVIDGDGIGAAAISKISSNAISEVIVVSPGSNYSYSTNFDGDSIATISPTVLNPARIKVIVPPNGGHGKDAVSELYAYHVMIRSELDGTESGTFTTNNDYRQFGLIENPQGWNSTSVYDSLYAIQTLSFQFVNDETLTGTFVVDSIVENETGASGVVVDYDSDTRTLTITRTNGTFANGDLITQEGNTATGTIFSGSINNPDLRPFSGKVLAISNREMIDRSELQAEVFHFIFTT